MSYTSTDRACTAALILSLLTPCLFADPPKAPQVSSFAPAEDLVGQARAFVAGFDMALATEQDFKEKKEQVKHSAHALAVVAVALGLHDTSE